MRTRPRIRSSAELAVIARNAEGVASAIEAWARLCMRNAAEGRARYDDGMVAYRGGRMPRHLIPGAVALSKANSGEVF